MRSHPFLEMVDPEPLQNYQQSKHDFSDIVTNFQRIRANQDNIKIVH